MNAHNDSMQVRWDQAHELPRFRPAYPHDQVVRWAFRNLDRNATPKAKVLDLGCGAGRHAIFFASEGFDVSACDISAVALRELQLVAERRSVVVHTHHTAGHDLSHYPDGAFDAVLCFGVIYYLSFEQAEKMVSEVFRVLRRGGKLCFVIRNEGDGRRVNASPAGRCTWHINALDPDAPSKTEEDMDMLFFSRGEVEKMFAPFAELCIDRMTYVHGNFTDDDWVVTAAKP